MFMINLFNATKHRDNFPDSNYYPGEIMSQPSISKKKLLMGAGKAKENLKDQDEILMAGFEVIEYKEDDPYTLEEWEDLLSYSQLVEVDRQRLYASLHKGIPKDLRKRIWLYLAKVDELKQENAKKGITYQWLLTQDCQHKYNIRKDITRTFPNHEFFNEHREERLGHLENILRAYASFDTEVGYTQGMNFLVGTLVYYMHLERTEKEYYVIDRDFESDIFWILVHIMYEKKWRSLYTDNTPKLVELLNQLEKRTKKELPKLHRIFQEYDLIPACFSQCFLTLLFYNTPLRFAKRVLDMFLLVGGDIILELIIRMLTLCQNDILRKKDIEELYPFLRSQIVDFTFKTYEKEFANLLAEHNSVKETYLTN